MLPGPNSLLAMNQGFFLTPFAPLREIALSLTLSRILQRRISLRLKWEREGVRVAHRRQDRNGEAFFSGLRKVFWQFAAVLFLMVVFWPSTPEAGHDDEYVETIPAERVKRMLEGGEKIYFLDLRAAGDFQKSRLPGARSIPIAELQKRYQEVPKSGRVILYCACPPGGVDEAYSYLALRGKGYRNVSVLQEGFSGWAQRKFPTESR
jgi:rhodanese-related sulfurtransferase